MAEADAQAAAEQQAERAQPAEQGRFRAWFQEHESLVLVVAVIAAIATIAMWWHSRGSSNAANNTTPGAGGIPTTAVTDSSTAQALDSLTQAVQNLMGQLPGSGSSGRGGAGGVAGGGSSGGGGAGGNPSGGGGSSGGGGAASFGLNPPPDAARGAHGGLPSTGNAAVDKLLQGLQALLGGNGAGNGGGGTGGGTGGANPGQSIGGIWNPPAPLAQGMPPFLLPPGNLNQWKLPGAGSNPGGHRFLGPPVPAPIPPNPARVIGVPPPVTGGGFQQSR